MVLVALELKNGVHDVFQHLGASQRAFLVDVADKNDAHTASLGIFEQTGGTFTNLRQTAGRGLHAFRLHGLDGVHHHQMGLRLLNAFKDLFQTSLAQDQQFTPSRGRLKAVGTQFDLAGTLLPAHIQHTPALHPQNGLQHQSALANARLAAQQHQTAGHQSATQDTVQLGIAHVHARFGIGINLVHVERTGTFPSVGCPGGLQCGPGGTAAGVLFRTQGHLLHGVPLAARRAFAHPSHAVLSTIFTNVDRLVLCCHFCICFLFGFKFSEKK